jgi:hypothetical protein
VRRKFEEECEEGVKKAEGEKAPGDLRNANEQLRILEGGLPYPDIRMSKGRGVGPGRNVDVVRSKGK